MTGTKGMSGAWDHFRVHRHVQRLVTYKTTRRPVIMHAGRQLNYAVHPSTGVEVGARLVYRFLHRSFVFNGGRKGQGCIICPELTSSIISRLLSSRSRSSTRLVCTRGRLFHASIPGQDVSSEPGTIPEEDHSGPRSTRQ